MKIAIVNVSIGSWYPKGQERLLNSLRKYAFKTEDTIEHYFFKTLPPNSRTHQQSNYGFKVHAIQEAINKGAEIILWLDSSMYAVGPIYSIIDKIKEQGYYFIDNGFNVRQTLSSRAKYNLGLAYDEPAELEKMIEVASGCFGLDMRLAPCKNLFKDWKFQEGLDSFNGNRNHDVRDNADPKFLFCRHDQSVLSVLVHRSGFYNLAKWGEEVFHSAHGENKSSVMICKGM